jgi:hypothetical protein
MLVAFDGNESLKRVERAIREKDASRKLVCSENIECKDLCTVMNDMYLSEDQVNQFKNEVKR